MSRAAAAQPGLPRSASSFGLSLLALCCAAAMLLALTNEAWRERTAWIPYLPFLPCAAAAIVMIAGESWLRWRHGALWGALTAQPQRPRSWQRIALRALGLAATWALVALAYALLPEYSGSFYGPYWQLLQSLAPLAPAVPCYLIWIDPRIEDGEDECLQLGRLLCGQRDGVNGPAIRRHLLGWVIKGFFLPLMSVYLDQDCRALLNQLGASFAVAANRFDFWFTVSYTIDLAFCVIGYATATRLFDSHLRSVEPTLLGWLAALLCYQPFYSVIGQYYLHYESRLYWDNWLAPWPPLQVAWGALVIGLSMIYGLSTVAFGLRFSNLTHRGIITGGPYRFSKHPAYLAKNLSWWLIAVPFIPVDGAWDALRRCTLLLLLNGVYFLRARTEERHLSRDPAYVAYARWMNHNGLLRALGRRWVLLRYTATS